MKHGCLCTKKSAVLGSDGEKVSGDDWMLIKGKRLWIKFVWGGKCDIE